MRRFTGPVLFVLFSVAIFAFGEMIGANYQPANSSAQQQTDSQPRPQDSWITKDAAGFFTFLLVIVGGLQLCLFGWQLWLIRESLIDAKVAADAAKEAAGAAKTHADTATATLQTMQNTAERQLRAYIFAHPAHFQNVQHWTYAGANATTPAVPRRRRISYSLEFRNSGQTPAYGLVQITVCDVFEEPPSEDLFSVENSDPVKSSGGVLAAGSFVTTDGTYIVSPQDETAINAGRKGLYVFGEFTYTDAFKKPRKGRFRFMHNKDTGLTNWAYAEAGNDEADS